MKTSLDTYKKPGGSRLRRLFFGLVFFTVLCVSGFVYWAQAPVISDGHFVEFTVKPGHGPSSVAQQVSKAGASMNASLFMLMARMTGKAGKVKPGPYELRPGESPWKLLGKLVRGEIAQTSITIIEGWTFKQMRQAVGAQPFLRHDTAGLTDKQLLEKIGVTDYKHPEGLFFPDTYMIAKGASDVQLFKHAHMHMMKRLNELWETRASDLPYKSPYQALIMASIVEKETGRPSDRGLIASVFVNRLRKGMRLQTDPTVIYGMGDKFDGNLRKRDLIRDTPYNTYTRRGLPPTPIALPGKHALEAALNPEVSDALYFVAKGDGSSHFSSSLREHNNAVIQYQLNGRARKSSQ